MPYLDAFRAFLIFLGEEKDKGLLQFLDILFSFQLSESRKREILEKDYQIEMTLDIDREMTISTSLSSLSVFSSFVNARKQTNFSYLTKSPQDE